MAKDNKFYSQHRFPFRTNFHAISSLFPMISTASQGKFVFSILHHQSNILIQKKKKEAVVQKQKLTQNVIYNKFFFFINVIILNTFSATTRCCSCTAALLTIYGAFIIYIYIYDMVLSSLYFSFLLFLIFELGLPLVNVIHVNFLFV